MFKHNNTPTRLHTPDIEETQPLCDRCSIMAKQLWHSAPCGGWKGQMKLRCVEPVHTDIHENTVLTEGRNAFSDNENNRRNTRYT